MSLLKLNLGCADRYVDGWMNVDYQSPHMMDQRVDLSGPLPWEPGSVSHVYAGHLFEHLTYDACQRLAKNLLECMDPRGGLLLAVGPDIDLAKKMIADGTFDFTHHNLESLQKGAGRWSGDEHHWETTGGKVVKLLKEAGWPVVSDIGIATVPVAWPVIDRNPQWQYAVRAWTGEQDETKRV